jgi:adenine-specific DNA-methyltransferase
VGPALDHHRHLPRRTRSRPRPHHGRPLPLLPPRRQPRGPDQGGRGQPQRAFDAPPTGDIRQGFVYERVPHITLKSIANNAEIDVIWEKFQEQLEPLRGRLNDALGKKLGGVGDPARGRRPLAGSGEGAAHAEWWEQRIARQKEIDASIAAKADFEYLYDKPYEDKKTVRVAGPFTVESLSPHRVLGVDENDELIDPLDRPIRGVRLRRKARLFQMILENLKTAGVQQAHKEDKILFTSLTPGRAS